MARMDQETRVADLRQALADAGVRAPGGRTVDELTDAEVVQLTRATIRAIQTVADALGVYAEGVSELLRRVGAVVRSSPALVELLERR